MSTTDDRHILLVDGVEWLRDPRFDFEQRLKDMPQEVADEYRRVLPVRTDHPFRQSVCNVLADTLEWDGSDSDAESRFIVPLQIDFQSPTGKATTMCHLHGIAVRQNDVDGIQEVEDDYFSEDLDLLTQLYEPDHPYYTATLPNGRAYVVFAVPYC